MARLPGRNGAGPSACISGPASTGSGFFGSTKSGRPPAPAGKALPASSDSGHCGAGSLPESESRHSLPDAPSPDHRPNPHLQKPEKQQQAAVERIRSAERDSPAAGVCDTRQHLTFSGGGFFWNLPPAALFSPSAFWDSLSFQSGAASFVKVTKKPGLLSKI